MPLTAGVVDRSKTSLGWPQPISHIALARAAAVAGDTATSRKAYQDFFAMWKDADADLEILKAARQEYARVK